MWKAGLEKRQNKSVMGEPNENFAIEKQEYEEYYHQEHQHLIDCANSEFGANNWSHSINRLETDCIDEIHGKYHVGVIALIRVELKTGRHHEGLGYGISNEKKSKPLSISIARKEAVLKGLRSALQCFFNVPAIQPMASPAAKGFGQANKVPRMIVAKLGIDEVDNSVLSHVQTGERKLRTPPKMIDDVNVLWKKSKRSSDSALQNDEFTSPNNTTCKTPAHNSNNTPSHLNTLTGSDGIEDEERKLERKRKQRQKQEEFRQRFKQNQLEKEPDQNSKLGEGGKMDELIENLDVAGTSFISTQELNEMIQTTVHPKTSGPLCRVPLLSSPPKEGPTNNWRSGPALDVKRSLIKADTYR